MRIVTEDGKIFGRLNVIDLAGLLLVMVVLSALIVVKLLPNRALRNVERMDREEPTLVKVILPRDSEWLAERIEIGDTAEDADRVGARVMGIERVNIGERPATLVTFWLRSRRRPSGILAFGPASVRVGESLRITTPRYTVSGPIYEISPQAE